VTGQTKADGYGAAHKKLRASWAPKVQAGGVACRPCHLTIAPDVPGERTGWHMGHNDDDRTLPALPEHARCNSAGSRLRLPAPIDYHGGPRSHPVTGLSSPDGLHPWSRKWY